MEISKDVTGTLRTQEHSHQPVIAGFNGWQSTTASMPVIEDGIPPIESTMPPYVLQGSMIGRQDKNGPQGDGINEDVSLTLNTTDRHAVVYGISAYDSNAMKSSNPHSGVYEAETARTLDLNGGSPACNQGGMAVAYDARGNGDGNTSPTLTGDHQNRVTDYTAIVSIQGINGDIAGTNSVVRRLTPLECERLQGFPDGWTDIPGASDTARYKALGNSIALPQWAFVLGNISKHLPTKATLGSLFDGISGFPLIWQRLHGDGSARWASEIEKFPISVTKYHFGEE